MSPIGMTKPRHGLRVEEPSFKEGDVIVRVLKTGEEGGSVAQDRAVLLKNDVSGPGDGWWALCFVRQDASGTKSLELTGLRESAFEYYRLAEPEERFQILSAMVGLSFSTYRGPKHFTRWQPKLETVIKPLIDQLKK